ncbi:MAG: hypothetical protein AAGD38_23515 [Acidobacteriota bacterium]
MTDVILGTVLSLLAMSLGVWCVAIGMGIIPTSDDFDKNDSFRLRFGKPLMVAGSVLLVGGGLWLIFI